MNEHCSEEDTKSLFFETTDEVLECFLEAALEDFVVGRVDQAQWHPDFCSQRVAIFILVKKTEETVNLFKRKMLLN